MFIIIKDLGIYIIYFSGSVTKPEAEVASDSTLLSTDRQVISGDDSPLTYCCDDWSSPGV